VRLKTREGDFRGGALHGALDHPGSVTASQYRDLYPLRHYDALDSSCRRLQGC